MIKINYWQKRVNFINSWRTGGWVLPGKKKFWVSWKRYRLCGNNIRIRKLIFRSMIKTQNLQGKDIRWASDIGCLEKLRRSRINDWISCINIKIKYDSIWVFNHHRSIQKIIIDEFLRHIKRKWTKRDALDNERVKQRTRAVYKHSCNYGKK